MIEEPHVTESAARRVALVHLTIPRSEIRHVMGPGLREIFDVLAAQASSRRALQG